MLRLISSTLLHFGKASELALHSASATPGIASELALLSLCATVEVGVVFAGGWEVVVGEVWEEGLELEEEAFAGEVAVGVHVEVN